MSVNDYIYLESERTIPLNYYETGFVDTENNNKIVLSDIMSVTYTIDLYNCADFYGDNVTDLTVILSLDSNYAKESNNDTFNLYDYITLSANVYQQDDKTIILYKSDNDATDTVEFEQVTNGSNFIEFTLSGILSEVNEGDTYSFTVEYTFTAESHDSFRKNIYGKINKTTFDTSALLNGGAN